MRERIDYLDVLRVLACFMVVFTHAGDVYVFDEVGGFGAAWSVFISLLRPCVPLFILLSGILLLPIKMGTGPFLKRRFSRVLIPFLVWSMIYVFLPIPGKPAFGGPANVFTETMNIYTYNLMMVPMNFTASNVHFWFLYTIIGLYLFMPILSPWIKSASRKELLGFLLIWAVTLLFPYIRLWFPEIQGECDWNDYGMLYNFGGFLGYIVLGYFLHRHNHLSNRKSILVGAVLFSVGAMITYRGLLFDIGRFKNFIAANDGAENWKLLELSIGFCTINVALMTAGLFMFFQKLSYPRWLMTGIRELSRLSFGLFLVHYIVNLWLSAFLPQALHLNHGVEQVILTCLVFVISYLLAKIISCLPKAKYLIG